MTHVDIIPEGAFIEAEKRIHSFRGFYYSRSLVHWATPYVE